MQHQISVITLGIDNLSRSRKFYVEGFGWEPVFENEEVIFYQMNGFVLGTWLAAALAEDMQLFENEEVIFYQMNGFVLGTWLAAALAEDMQRSALERPGAFALAHNVPAKDQVQPLLDRLTAMGGTLLRAGDAPSHGGFRGYVADPDDHGWEIAWNPAWTIDEKGHVTFAV